MTSKTDTPRVCADFNRHTCIEVSRQAGLVSHIPLSITGLELLELNSAEFDRTYRVLADYPAEKAAKLYAEYAALVGGTTEAMQTLANIVPLTRKEIEMATAKKAASAAAKTQAADKAKAQKAPAKKVEKPEPAPNAEKKVAVKAPSTKAKTKAQEPGDSDKKPRVSASQMFKDLIMEGKLNDRQIFAAVQKVYDLDDNKFNYVNWNYTDLVRKGMNPPALKKAAT